MEDSGRLRGDQSVCVGLYVAAVCADGWAWLVFFSFFFRGETTIHNRWIYSSTAFKRLILMFPVGPPGEFSGEFDKISNAHFFVDLK